MELDEEHTKCGICVAKFSSDRDNKDPEIRKHLPVLSSSQRCDHWFCHGCILREQLRIAEENNGKIPKWIRCMHCREKTSFNPAEPKYHRLLIDLLARQKYAAAQIKAEQTEGIEENETTDVTSVKQEQNDAFCEDYATSEEKVDGEGAGSVKRETDITDLGEQEVKRAKLIAPSPPLVRVKEEPTEFDDYDETTSLERRAPINGIDTSTNNADNTPASPKVVDKDHRICFVCKVGKSLDCFSKNQRKKGENAERKKGEALVCMSCNEEAKARLREKHRMWREESIKVARQWNAKNEARIMTNLPFSMMPDTEPPQPNNEELLTKFRALCKANRNIREKYNRLEERVEEDMDKDEYKYYSRRYGKFLGKLLSFQLFEVRTKVPMYLVHQGIVREFPIKKEMSEAKQKANRDRQQTPVDININFRRIGNSDIPVFQKKQVTMVKAGDYLTNDDLKVAMNLIGKNVDNVAVVLLLIYQYKTKMFDYTKENVLDGEEYEQNIKKVGSVLSVTDQVMEQKLPTAAHLKRSAWILASYADPDHDLFYHQPMRRYREEQRVLYLKQLKNWGDSTRLPDEEKLRRCHFFHLFVIMSGSQGCKDEDGIERLNLLISGERTGSLSVCYPLRNSNIVDYINFVTDVLKSGKSQAMDQLRAISFVEIAILCETVWKSKLPSNYRDLCRVYQAATHRLQEVSIKTPTVQSLTMLVELDDEHTKCGICIAKFSSDRNNKNPEIRKHLPVLSSSQRCDHWFCHGCILREQLRVAEENNGKVPKWIKCMHCREKTSFNPAEPKYHRLLIDLLARAQKYAAVQVKAEQTEVEENETTDVTPVKQEQNDAFCEDYATSEEKVDGEGAGSVKRETDITDLGEQEVKRAKLIAPSPPLVRVKEEPTEFDDYDETTKKSSYQWNRYINK